MTTLYRHNINQLRSMRKAVLKDMGKRVGGSRRKRTKVMDTGTRYDTQYLEWAEKSHIIELPETDPDQMEKLSKDKEYYDKLIFELDGARMPYPNCWIDMGDTGFICLTAPLREIRQIYRDISVDIGLHGELLTDDLGWLHELAFRQLGDDEDMILMAIMGMPVKDTGLQAWNLPNVGDVILLNLDQPVTHHCITSEASEYCEKAHLDLEDGTLHQLSHLIQPLRSAIRPHLLQSVRILQDTRFTGGGILNYVVLPVHRYHFVRLESLFRKTIDKSKVEIFLEEDKSKHLVVYYRDILEDIMMVDHLHKQNLEEYLDEEVYPLENVMARGLLDDEWNWMKKTVLNFQQNYRQLKRKTVLAGRLSQLQYLVKEMFTHDEEDHPRGYFNDMMKLSTHLYLYNLSRSHIHQFCVLRLAMFLHGYKHQDINVIPAYSKSQLKSLGTKPGSDKYRTSILTISGSRERPQRLSFSLNAPRAKAREHQRRGHWRHYQSGEKIWIEHMTVNKGVGSLKQRYKSEI